MRVVDPAEERLDCLGVCLVVEALGQLVHGIGLELPLPHHRPEVVGGAVGVVEEVVLDEVLVDGLGIRRGEAHLLAVHLERPSAEEVELDLLRPLAQRAPDVALQVPHEGLVALRGDDREHVHALDLVGPEELGVLAHAVLVNAEAHSAADLLTLGGLRPRLLERADLEDVGVVPALAQGRVAEDEPHGLVEREQPLLVLEDEVVAAPGVIVVDADALRRLGLLLALGLDRVALLVDGEVPVVDLVRRVAPQVLQVARVREVVRRGVREPIRNGGGILLLEDLPVADGRAVAGHVAVLRDLVDEEEREALDAATEERLLLLEVAPDGLAYLHALHVLEGGVVVDGALLDLHAIEEADVAGTAVHAGDDAVVAAGNLVATVGLEPRRARGVVDAVSLFEAARGLPYPA